MTDPLSRKSQRAPGQCFASVEPKSGHIRFTQGTRFNGGRAISGPWQNKWWDQDQQNWADREPVTLTVDRAEITADGQDAATISADKSCWVKIGKDVLFVDGSLSLTADKARRIIVTPIGRYVGDAVSIEAVEAAEASERGEAGQALQALKVSPFWGMKPAQLRDWIDANLADRPAPERQLLKFICVALLLLVRKRL